MDGAEVFGEDSRIQVLKILSAALFPELEDARSRLPRPGTPAPPACRPDHHAALRRHRPGQPGRAVAGPGLDGLSAGFGLRFFCRGLPLLGLGGTARDVDVLPRSPEDAGQSEGDHPTAEDGPAGPGPDFPPAFYWAALHQAMGRSRLDRVGLSAGLFRDLSAGLRLGPVHL